MVYTLESLFKSSTAVLYQTPPFQPPDFAGEAEFWYNIGVMEKMRLILHFKRINKGESLSSHRDVVV
jgi:hypothetical protein